MALRIYNTLTRRVEDFVPIEPGHVRTYEDGSVRQHAFYTPS